MKLNFNSINPNKLHQELMENNIIPTLVENDLKEGEYIAENTWITFDDVDVTKVNEIVNNMNPLDEIKKNKINELSRKCNETIINGFYSDADGTKKLYDFDLENQVNLSTKAYQIQISQLAGQPITTVSYYAKGDTCHDYTTEQFLKLAQDGETWKTTNIVKYKDVLKPKVEACTTKEEIEVITWESDVNATQTTV